MSDGPSIKGRAHAVVASGCRTDRPAHDAQRQLLAASRPLGQWQTAKACLLYTSYLAGELTRIGIDLQEVRVVSDRHEAIVAAVNDLRHAYDHLFTSGGIGPTHDDITVDAIAAALALPLGIRDDARAILSDPYQRSGTDLNDAPLRMARIPGDAVLIENPISAAPGFSLCNVPVSYTHLDVYKRQGPEGETTWPES